MWLTLRCVIYIINSVLYFSTVTGEREETWTFPDEFLIGAGTSAYQIEGAWNVSDKGENVWDKYTHDHPDRIFNQENGDIACDSYHKFKEDVQLIKQLGMNHYRFSLSWSRILPTGYPNIISKDGVKYYNALLDELEKNNIIPFVTLYHWDHPQIFQDMGGWTNEAMVDMFVDYARVVFQLFGNRVKIFATINEPSEVCQSGLLEGTSAPGLKLGKHAVYLCTHNILKAHARVYHMYDDEFRAQQNGKVGIVINTFNYYSKYENDNISNEIAFQFKFGIFANAIFSKEGDYPAVVKHQIAENSNFEGLLRSRLPIFSKSWIEYIRGTADYLGLNSYSSRLVEPAPKSNYTVYANDDGLLYSYDERWPKSASNWLRVVPEGFLDLLKKIKNDYGNPLVFVTENGVSDFGTVEDDQRIEYLYSYMKAMLTAIKKYGCNVKAYTIWSLLDNFEWSKGYSEKFGLFHVDFSHPNRTRTPKKSVYWLTKVLRTRKLQPITIKKK